MLKLRPSGEAWQWVKDAASAPCLSLLHLSDPSQLHLSTAKVKDGLEAPHFMWPSSPDWVVMRERFYSFFFIVWPTSPSFQNTTEKIRWQQLSYDCPINVFYQGQTLKHPPTERTELMTHQKLIQINGLAENCCCILDIYSLSLLYHLQFTNCIFNELPRKLLNPCLIQLTLQTWWTSRSSGFLALLELIVQHSKLPILPLNPEIHSLRSFIGPNLQRRPCLRLHLWLARSVTVHI